MATTTAASCEAVKGQFVRNVLVRFSKNLPTPPDSRTVSPEVSNSKIIKGKLSLHEIEKENYRSGDNNIEEFEKTFKKLEDGCRRSPAVVSSDMAFTPLQMKPKFNFNPLAMPFKKQAPLLKTRVRDPRVLALQFGDMPVGSGLELPTIAPDPAKPKHLEPPVVPFGPSKTKDLELPIGPSSPRNPEELQRWQKMYQKHGMQRQPRQSYNTQPAVPGFH